MNEGRITSVLTLYEDGEIVLEVDLTSGEIRETRKETEH